MNKKIHKILGVVVTLAMLFSLIVAATPVGADTGGNNKWKKFDIPEEGSDGKYFMDLDFENMGPMEKAIDGTLFVAAYYDSDPSTSLDWDIFKSSDGRSWSKTSYQSESVDDTVMPVDIVCSSMDADIVYVTDGTYIYWTENAKDFETLANPPVDDDVITAMDVGYLDDDKPYIFVGTMGNAAGDDVWVGNQDDFGLPWEPMDVMTDRSGAFGGVDVWDVRVSPDFDSTQAVTAIVTDTVAGESYVTTKFGGAQWGVTEDDCELLIGDDSDNSFAITDGAVMWLPDNFDDGDIELFVAVDGTDYDTNVGDVFWVIGATCYDLERNADINDLHGAGEAGDTEMIAGYTNGTVKYTTDSGDSWSTPKKQPSGDGDVFVRVAEDFLDSSEAWAAVNQTGDEMGMAVSFTMDNGKHWNQISLMDTDFITICDIEPTPDWGSSGNLFMVTSPDDYELPYRMGDSLWKYDGDNWERIFYAGLLEAGDDYISDVEVSPEWTSDDAVFFGDSFSGRHYRSTDGGMRFIRGNSSPDGGFVFNWLVIDDSTLLVATEDDILRTTNNGTTWKDEKTGIGEPVNHFAQDPNNPDNILAGAMNGKVYISSNGGDSWSAREALPNDGPL